jgi:hypothetical protein
VAALAELSDELSGAGAGAAVLDAEQKATKEAAARPVVPKPVAFLPADEVMYMGEVKATTTRAGTSSAGKGKGAEPVPLQQSDDVVFVKEVCAPATRTGAGSTGKGAAKAQGRGQKRAAVVVADSDEPSEDEGVADSFIVSDSEPEASSEEEEEAGSEEEESGSGEPRCCVLSASSLASMCLPHCCLSIGPISASCVVSCEPQPLPCGLSVPNASSIMPTHRLPATPSPR